MIDLSRNIIIINNIIDKTWFDNDVVAISTLDEMYEETVSKRSAQQATMGVSFVKSGTNSGRTVKSIGNPITLLLHDEWTSSNRITSILISVANNISSVMTWIVTLQHWKIYPLNERVLLLLILYKSQIRNAAEFLKTCDTLEEGSFSNKLK